MPSETILVVDDSKEIRRFLCETVLEPVGYRVFTATNGHSALREALRHKPDLILLDINLPVQSGLDVLRTLGVRGYTFPAIIMTSHGSEQAILQSFRLGAKDFLQKPFSAEDGLDAVARALAESRWQRERTQMAEELAEANSQLQQQVRTWASLNEIGQTITSTLDEKDVQRRLMLGINQLMQVEAGSLFLVDERTGELVLQVSLRGDIEKKAEIRLRPGQGIVGWVAQHSQPALVPDAPSDERFFPEVDKKSTGFLTRSVLAVPLVSKAKLLGVIQVINPRGAKAQFDRADQELLEVLASTVAIAVENARLHAQMRQTITAETIQRMMVTLSHYINNSLQVFSMVAYALDRGGKNGQFAQHPGRLRELATMIYQESNQITAVLTVLNKMTKPQDAVYQGDTHMIDIEREIRALLEPKKISGP